MTVRIMRCVILVLSLFLSQVSQASTCAPYGLDQLTRNETAADPSLIPFPVLGHYRQTKHQLSDLIGDYILAKQAVQTARRIRWYMKRQLPSEAKEYYAALDSAFPCALEFFELPITPYDGYGISEKNVSSEYFMNPAHMAQIENLEADNADKEKLLAEYQKGSLNFEGRDKPIRIKKLNEALLTVLREEYQKNAIEPSVGKIHTWSPEFRDKFAGQFFPYSTLSKLLVALSRGETFKYMFTEHEAELHAWVVAQPYRSVTMPEMFRRSYQLNNGDVYLTLLTIENLMAPLWQYRGREMLSFALRLRPITNHLGLAPDNYGSWYHFFGMALYGYAKSAFRAFVVGNAESIGSHIMGRFKPERQEDYINSLGGFAGGALYRAVHKKAHLLTPDNSLLEENYYLNLNEDFSPRLKRFLKK